VNDHIISKNSDSTHLLKKVSEPKKEQRDLRRTDETNHQKTCSL